MISCGITRLTLRDFRSYRELDLVCDAPLIALTGENGAGKTNILEALSLLSPGRGLRRADLNAMACHHGSGGLVVSAAWRDGETQAQMGLSVAAPDGEGKRARSHRVDGADVPSSAAFAQYLRVVWLTPEFDGLFRASAGERRRFLDRLVLAVDPAHAQRSGALERALRSRNRLLEENPNEGRWLDAIEQEIAEIGIAVAAARAETVHHLNAVISETRDPHSPFPWADLQLDGEIDALVAAQPALEAEDAYRRVLRQNRTRDRAAGRTLVGPQASDLMVRHGPKDIPAQEGSTGEQKALIIGLVLAHARLVQRMSGLKPLVLLDEIAAHLDARRRGTLYAELAALGGQIWMTGTDVALFSALPQDSVILHVADGKVAAL
jgi:DNA replication and repair protein RecF